MTEFKKYKHKKSERAEWLEKRQWEISKEEDEIKKCKKVEVINN